MNEALQNITIRDLMRIAPGLDEHNIGNDFFLCDVKDWQMRDAASMIRVFDYPIRIDGYLCIVCMQGSFTAQLNLNSYKVEKNEAIFITPGVIGRLSDAPEENLEDLHLVLVGMSREYLSGIRLDFSRLYTESINILQSPLIRFTEEDLRIGEKYFQLADIVLTSDLQTRKEIIGGLISSLMFFLSELWTRNIEKARILEPPKAGNRINGVFKRFIDLVTEYHTTERGMAFYAEQLCLTPKYLSKLVKQASGRSAPEWIDAFVILEAKNLLRFSDCTIKEIVYRLHFPNQSVFYKYFKSHTGMTPSEYRKS